MTQQTNTPTPVSYHARPIDKFASAHAPFLYFEEAPTFGHTGGVIQITLEAASLHGTHEAVAFERVIVAHLRMNIPAALALKAAIDGALLLAQPSQSTSKN
jgi:hypothetical protein